MTGSRCLDIFVRHSPCTLWLCFLLCWLLPSLSGRLFVSLLVKLPTGSDRLTSRPPSHPGRKTVPLSQELGKTHRGLLLAQPGSHAHHEPITVLGGVRALIGQVADDVKVDKLHGLSVEEG